LPSGSGARSSTANAVASSMPPRARSRSSRGVSRVHTTTRPRLRTRALLHRIPRMAGAPVDLIQSVPLFSDLERREIEQLARSFKERIFSPGDHITEEGKGGVGFFVIESGKAKILVHGEERGEYGPGDYFGEIALIDAGTRSATITAET